MSAGCAGSVGLSAWAEFMERSQSTPAPRNSLKKNTWRRKLKIYFASFELPSENSRGALLRFNVRVDIPHNKVCDSMTTTRTMTHHQYYHSQNNELIENWGKFPGIDLSTFNKFPKNIKLLNESPSITTLLQSALRDCGSGNEENAWIQGDDCAIIIFQRSEKNKRKRSNKQLDFRTRVEDSVEEFRLAENWNEDSTRMYGFDSDSDSLVVVNVAVGNIVKKWCSAIWHSHHVANTKHMTHSGQRHFAIHFISFIFNRKR